MTGFYPHACGVTRCNVALPADLPTLAEMLPDEYACAHMGKWHLGDEIFPQHGFERWVGSEDTYRRFYSSPELLDHLSDYHHFLAAAGFEPDAENLGQKVYSRHMAASMEEPYTKAAFLGQQAVQFLDEIGDTPFVLVVSYLEPHPPHTGPFNDTYDPSSLPVGPNFRRKPAANTPLLNRVMAAYYAESEEYGIDLRTEAGWREVRARYWGNITLVDRSVGAILHVPGRERAGRQHDRRLYQRPRRDGRGPQHPGQDRDVRGSDSRADAAPGPGLGPAAAPDSGQFQPDRPAAHAPRTDGRTHPGRPAGGEPGACAGREGEPGREPRLHPVEQPGRPSAARRGRGQPAR